ncbi:kinase-like domain-containing protein [Coniella lustricola]|uniref:Kinase-like domain-containing protein n=1 Tax=Coniella lustricola TaxID=2025994 RepID=A0A2T3AFM0_9PEZI|nr:kinase-like domain-containing protein [Coniella lustricola]
MSGDPIASLVIEDLTSPEHGQKVVTLHEGNVLHFGRDAETSNYILPDFHVSRNHFEIYSFVADEGAEPIVVVRDCESVNGTYVSKKWLGYDMKVVDTVILDDGDIISVNDCWSISVTLLAVKRDNMTILQQRDVKHFAEKYVITNKILGMGVSTCVRLAYDISSHEQLACKMYNIGDMRRLDCQNEVDQLIRSLDLLHELDHPNVASLRQVYKNEDVVYVFEELATGGDLFSMFMKPRLLEELEVCFIMFQVVRALKYIHSKGIAHRDIKVENVLCMVCPKVGQRVALTDFGHARRVSQGSITSRAGTPGWQAPEQYSGTHEHGIAVDMWAVGIMAVRLLVGNREVPTLEEFESNLSVANPSPDLCLDNLFDEIRQIRQTDIYSAVKDFISRCLDFNPAARMTAGEALSHPWLSEPKDVRELFEFRQARAEKNWRPRAAQDGWLEELPPNVGLEVQTSPYFHNKEENPIIQAEASSSDKQGSKGSGQENTKSSKSSHNSGELPTNETIQNFGCGGELDTMS